MWQHRSAAHAGIIILQEIAIGASVTLGGSQAHRTSFVDSVANIADYHIATSGQVHLVETGRTSIAIFAGIAANIALSARTINIRILPN